MVSNPLEMTVAAIAAAVRSRQVSATEVARLYLDRIDEADRPIHSLLEVMSAGALAGAGAVDQAISAGKDPGPLAGVPIVVKDNMCTRGVPTTCGSRILEGYRPPYNATVIDRLAAAGAVVIAKANLDEFAMGSSTENSAFGPTRNPWNTDCVPGGSSGGSAAAVAAGLAPASLGSDTGGSIRQPASLCGVVGMKPTYGCVSRYGLVAYASSLDQIGPMTRTVGDNALVLNAIAGHDPRDSTSLNLTAGDYSASIGEGVKGLRLGVPVEFMGDGIAPGVAGAVRKAIDTLCDLGAIAEECSLPDTAYCLPTYYIIAPAEASSNLARFDGVKYGLRSSLSASHVGLMEQSREEGFGAEVKQRIMIGTYALSAGYYDAYYKRAQQVRTLIRRDFDQAFARFDAILTPTSPTVAFRIGERSDDPLAMKLADICTLPANLAGIPGISVPCGMDDGLPVGLQIMGAPLSEAMVYRIAHAYEQATGWAVLRPGVPREAN